MNECRYLIESNVEQSDIFFPFRNWWFNCPWTPATSSTRSWPSSWSRRPSPSFLCRLRRRWKTTLSVRMPRRIPTAQMPRRILKARRPRKILPLRIPLTTRNANQRLRNRQRKRGKNKENLYSSFSFFVHILLRGYFSDFLQCLCVRWWMWWFPITQVCTWSFIWGLNTFNFNILEIWWISWHLVLFFKR